MKKWIKPVMYVTSVLYLCGCTTMNTNQSSNAGDECDATTTGAMGALAGGLLGAAIGGQDAAAKGAAAGAVIGAVGCIAYNYQSEQVKTAQVVNQEYQASHGNVLPAAPTVADHKMALSKNTAVKGKDQVTITSRSTIVDGATQPVSKVEEKLVIVDQSGNKKPVSTKSPTNTTGGEYKNTFTITPPEGMAEGKYRVESNIYVNGKLASKTGGALTVVYGDPSMVLAKQ